MSYTTAYDECDDQLEPHYSRTCDDETEKARIRRGAFIHKSVLATIIADPTDNEAWEVAIADGKILIMPELAGTFDGGTPKMGPGYGDQKETFIGSDFKAVVKDPLYKENWGFYKSLAGKSSYHFAYCTETQVHITGKPVTVASKNPITDNIEDNVIWESELSWFEKFTPAPHDAPDVFTTP